MNVRIVVAGRCRSFCTTKSFLCLRRAPVGPGVLSRRFAMYVSLCINHPRFLRISLAGLRCHCLLGAVILMLFHCPAALSLAIGNSGSFVRAAQPQVAVTQEQLPELRKLADEAKNSFRLLLEPPTPLITTFLRNETSAFRDYALFNYESAIDALLAEAAHSGSVAAVEKALRRLVLKGDTSAAKAILAGVLKRKDSEAARPNRKAAAAARHLAALGEYSELWVDTQPLNYDRVPALFGAKALPLYRHAAELDPEDAWDLDHPRGSQPTLMARGYSTKPH